MMPALRGRHRRSALAAACPPPLALPWDMACMEKGEEGVGQDGWGCDHGPATVPRAHPPPVQKCRLNFTHTFRLVPQKKPLMTGTKKRRRRG